MVVVPTADSFQLGRYHREYAAAAEAVATKTAVVAARAAVTTVSLINFAKKPECM